jgi:hypothetical protein
MIKKKYVTELKYSGNSDITSLVVAQGGVGINFVLENLGQLPNNFHAGFLSHNHSQVRLNAAKNIVCQAIHGLSVFENSNEIKRIKR